MALRMKLLTRCLPVALMVCPLLSAPALATSFGAGIENSQWYLSESVFECALVHEVPGYGRATFRHRAGESLLFSLEADIPLMRPGRGMLVAEAPSWRPGVAPRSLGLVTVPEGSRAVVLSAIQSMQVAYGLLDGLSPTLTRQSWFDAQLVRVHVSNINFASPFQGYLACAGNLLPANLDQLQGSQILFSSASVALNDADRRSLDKIVAYVLADSTVTAVLVDGHTDRTGSRIDNRQLAQDRAEVVAGYLKSQGVAESKITVRAHGDQFSASGNSAQNRRVVIRMEREGDSTQLQQASVTTEPDSG
jgi:outer membrane protein OmpA-like peptidoglycan-associated protein